MSPPTTTPLSARGPVREKDQCGSRAARPLSARGPTSKRLPSATRRNGNGGYRAAVAANEGGLFVRSFSPGREQEQLFTALEREYAADLSRVSPDWTVGGSCSSTAPVTASPVDLTQVAGLPAVVLGAILAGKCRDQRVPVTPERQRRFIEWMYSNCNSNLFLMNDASVGSECAKGIMLALTLNPRFTSLNLACNSLGDAGAATIALALPDHLTLQHVDLSANDINHRGANAIFEALRRNSSVLSLDLSSKPGSLRNRLQPKANAIPLEVMLLENKTLTELLLYGAGLGTECAAGIARGLSGNLKLRVLDLAGNDIGPKGAIAIAEGVKSSALEELNLSDNRIGEEGLLAFANMLGALPLSTEASNHSKCWSSGPEGFKASTKYIEAFENCKRVIGSINLKEVQERDDISRSGSLAQARDAVLVMCICAKASEVQLPRLKVLQLANCAASVAVVARVEDALQVNPCLEKIILDQNEHRGDETGASSLMVMLASNTGLRHLSLHACFLGRIGVVNTCRGLILNQVLKSLSLSGTAIHEEAAVALRYVLVAAKALKSLNLNGCHLDDASGVAIANGIALNSSLETLLMRDNCLHEVSAHAFVEALQRNTTLTTLNLELNSIDVRFLLQLKQLLSRNRQLREKQMPDVYRQRIEELLKCEQEVAALEALIERNYFRKRRALLLQAAKHQELLDTRAREQMRQRELEEEIEGLEIEAKCLDEEISSMDKRLQLHRAEGDVEASQLQSHIKDIELKIKSCEKHVEATRKQLSRFEEASSAELAALNEELERAEKARNSAQMLASSAQRNLDSFTTSLKAIGEDMSGGVDPRKRLTEVANEDVVRMSSYRSIQAQAVKPTASASKRPRTPLRSGRPKASSISK